MSIAKVCRVVVEFGCLFAISMMIGWWVIPVWIVVGLVGGAWEAEWRHHGSGGQD